MLVGSLPVAGSIQSIVELVTGRDFITGEEVSRVLAGVGILAGVIPAGKGLLKAGSKVALDNNAIVLALEQGFEAAVDAAIAGRIPIVSRQVVREFLARPGRDINTLRTFLADRGGRLALSGSEAAVKQLQQLAQDLGRVLKPKDARVAASAARESVPVITDDKTFRNFLNAVGIGGESFR